MNITERFVADILKKEYPTDYQPVYDESPLLQYLDKKMKAVHGNSKTRRSLANIYAIYSILYFYQSDFYEKKSEYRRFEGYDYMRLFNFYRSLYGGNKLQNHHYKNIKVYFGYTRETIAEIELELYKTGRTNANDGGIDFVMRPVGRFFQVTEVNNYDKYLLDIDKVMHFPISFVIKTTKQKSDVLRDLEQYITLRSSGMTVLERRYKEAIEEIITINELQKWTRELGGADIDGIIRDIDIYYRLEMNMDAEDEG